MIETAWLPVRDEWPEKSEIARDQAKRAHVHNTVAVMANPYRISTRATACAALASMQVVIMPMSGGDFESRENSKRPRRISCESVNSVIAAKPILFFHRAVTSSSVLLLPEHPASYYHTCAQQTYEKRTRNSSDRINDIEKPRHYQL
jgi:hypothetical protein